jgi:circadian clock protein KaiC
MERGDRAALFTFEEGAGTLFSRTKGFGIDLQKYLDKGLLLLSQIDPAELSPGEFANRVRESVQEKKATVVVIDSLNGFLNAMPEERFLVIQLHELLTFLNTQGVTSMLVTTQHGILGTQMSTPVDASYLADNVILFRFYEVSGEVRKAISVMKKRSGVHETTIRELFLGDKGVTVGPPLRKMHGVLTGIPQALGGNGDEDGRESMART